MSYAITNAGMAKHIAHNMIVPMIETILLLQPWSDCRAHVEMPLAHGAWQIMMMDALSCPLVVEGYLAGPIYLACQYSSFCPIHET